jgi:PAS domain S-box-containing protein
MQFDAVDWIESDPAPVLLVTTDGGIVAANRAVSRMLRATPADLQGRSLPELLRDEKEATRTYLKLCARSRESLPGTFSWALGDGGIVEMRVEGRVLRPRSDSDAAVIFLACHLKDDAAEQFLLLNQKITALSREITLRRRMEEERDLLLSSERAARNEAERIGRMKDEFLATLSHELRTPLNAILGWTQILRLDAATAADIAEGLEVIERNTRVQAKLIEDLLDVSRIISGKVRLDVQRIDVSSVLEAAIQSVRPTCDSKGIRLHQVLDSIGGMVMGDPNRLQQVFWNLLSNAVKFTSREGKIQVLLERVNSHIEVAVIDSGIGIAPEFLPHVFERFRQADSSTTRQYGGLGLGLAISRHLVELHGGTIRAKSPGIGHGTSMIVSLPVTALHDAHESPLGEDSAPKSQTDSQCPPDMAGLTVLAVDDEPDSLAMVAKVLESCGCTVLTAANVADALGLLRSARPDVLVTDIGMPGQDGYALIKEVRSLPLAAGGKTPAVALTAFARSEDRRRVIMAGFQMHLAKPAERDELIAVVASVAGLTMGPTRNDG